jgi:Leucine-rich repeat (LRR) protein
MANFSMLRKLPFLVFLALISCVFGKIPANNKDSIASSERDVLVELFKSMNGSGWEYNYGWLTSLPVCSWFGVICNSNGSVVQLNLYGNQLSGTIPWTLGKLDSLIGLNLQANHIVGTIPSSLGHLNGLIALNLNNNQVNGTIPSSLGQLEKLQQLTLHYNQLSGAIPSSLGQIKNLEIFFVGNNQLTGTIPSSLGLLEKLENLNLESNQLTGISNDLLQPISLKNCYFANNPFRCSIPRWTLRVCNAVCH